MSNLQKQADCEVEGGKSSLLCFHTFFFFAFLGVLCFFVSSFLSAVTWPYLFLISFISPPTSWPARQINVQTRQPEPYNNRPYVQTAVICRPRWEGRSQITCQSLGKVPRDRSFRSPSEADVIESSRKNRKPPVWVCCIRSPEYHNWAAENLYMNH